MAPTPFTFYRGAAAIMAADLAWTPSTGLGVQACGDAHLSNFGGFATPERRLVFDINDFDETLPGPWEWDVLRLAASFAVAATVEFSDLDGSAREDLGRSAASASVASYRRHMAQYARLPTLEVWYSAIDVDQIEATLSRPQARVVSKAVTKARRRNSMQALGKLAENVDGHYRIRHDPPLIVPLEEHDATLELIHGYFDDYLETISEERRVLLSRYRICDVALKVVGVGSVGTRCWIVLLQGDGAPEGTDPLFLQVKEATASVLEPHTATSRHLHAGQRVVIGQRLIQSFPDIFLGWTGRTDSVQYYLRQLRDMKLPVDAGGFQPAGFVTYAETCGWALARAHARSGDASAIAGYLGSNDTFDKAAGEFAMRYAAQNALDHEAFLQAIADRRIDADTLR